MRDSDRMSRRKWVSMYIMTGRRDFRPRSADLQQGGDLLVVRQAVDLVDQAPAHAGAQVFAQLQPGRRQVPLQTMQPPCSRIWLNRLKAAICALEQLVASSSR
jgi:hypothetical protein